MRLSSGINGRLYQIKEIKNTDKKVVDFLNNLGFIGNETVEVVTNIGGNTIIKIKGSTISLSKRITDNIEVRRI